MAKLTITIEDTKSSSGKDDITVRIESDPGFPGPAAEDQTLTPAQELALHVMEIAHRSAPVQGSRQIIQRLREGEAQIAVVRERLARDMQKNCELPLLQTVSVGEQLGPNRNGDIYPPEVRQRAYAEYAESQRGKWSEIAARVRSRRELQRALGELVRRLLSELQAEGPAVLVAAQCDIEHVLSEACVKLAPELNWITVPQEPPEGRSYREASPTDAERFQVTTPRYTVYHHRADAAERLVEYLTQMPAVLVEEVRRHGSVAVERPQLYLTLVRGTLEFFAWMDCWCVPKPNKETP